MFNLPAARNRFGFGLVESHLTKLCLPVPGSPLLITLEISFAPPLSSLGSVCNVVDCPFLLGENMCLLVWFHSPGFDDGPKQQT